MHQTLAQQIVDCQNMDKDRDTAESAGLHLPTTTEQPAPARRAICSNCSRPSPVCLCHCLPNQPIQTSSQIIILQHPHEASHKLSTVPILSKCLRNATILVGRRLLPGLSSLLDQSPRAIYLFPSANSSPALTLTHFHKSSNLLRTKDPHLVLIVFDGTWKHAAEMVKASHGFLSNFATRVCLDCDENVGGRSIYDSELILRREPFAGCVSTMEAVSRCLKVIEPNGMEIEMTLIAVLREMVRLQASFLKPIKPRPKLSKKKIKEEQNKTRLVDV